jgi:BirA family transcriptional regulator, biotin operon repressor / biotin---[acetyl-CoA-carboxylase] ligase
VCDRSGVIGEPRRKVIGEPRLYTPECESTQLLLLGADLPEGAVAVTDHQTSGRGRLGRTWVEASGTAVLCSVLLRPPAERRAAELSLVAAVAVAEAVEAATGLSAQIKWPNDVMLNRRKVAGILAEMRDESVVVGIGVNVNQMREQLPPDTRTLAGSLRSLTGREYDRDSVLSSLLSRLDLRYEQWRADGLDGVFDDLGSRDFLRGRRVRIGDESGTAVQIDRQGRLEIAFDGTGHRAIESGEVEFER